MKNQCSPPPKIASVCTGIAGFDIAFQQAGFELAWMCEIDRQCRGRAGCGVDCPTHRLGGDIDLPQST